MSVTGALGQVNIETPPPAGLPSLPVFTPAGKLRSAPLHLQRWWTEGSVTGDSSGGVAQVTFVMRNAQSAPKMYVAITSLTVAAVATADDVLVQVDQGDYVEHQVLNGLRSGLTGAKSQWANAVILPDVPLYIGQLLPNVDGVIAIVFGTNTNLGSHSIHARGFVSTEYPYEIPPGRR